MDPPRPGAGEVLLVAFRLGLTSFGGPIAHIGYFRREYVERRRWIDEATFAQLVALCQSLPGPASSQLGIAVGTLRAGVRGGVAAWLGFTLPSAVALIAFALITDAASVAAAPWVHGLQLAAVAVVAQAVWLMRIGLAPDGTRRLIALAALVASLLWVSRLTSVAVIASGALLGFLVLRPGDPGSAVSSNPDPAPTVHIGHRTGLLALGLFAGMLIGLPVLRVATGSEVVELTGTFYRAGALVFGGGHVVLPVLQDSVVATGWLDQDRFLAGYGAAQAVPGPLFTFAGYLGALISIGPGGVTGGTLAIVSIFLPGALLIWAALPFWDSFRRSVVLQSALAGIGAAVVGLLAAALYDPIWRTAVNTPADVVIALGGLTALVVLRVPSISVVLGAALICQALSLT